MYRSNEELTEIRPVARVGRAVGERPNLTKADRALKRCFDIIAALFFLLLFAPLLIVVALAIRFSSPGPILYSQPRIGRKGKSFQFFKFRSMVTNADEVLTAFLDSDFEARSQWDIYQKLDDDPRITPIGRFIRRTSLDELPQLWNVLTGDMSIVGPRPCMPGQKNLYGAQWASYCAVRPGLTGLWQVSGRNKLTYADRVRLDAEYVAKWSLWLDLKILFKTVRVVLTADGSR